MSSAFEKAIIEVIAPSNIAWIKYWGKSGLQSPMNASISMPLKNCVTRSKFEFVFGASGRAEVSLLFEGKEQQDFLPKIETFLGRTHRLYPVLKSLKRINIISENSFPHSSGIASSASAFCAFAMALEELQARVDGSSKDLKRASNAARLGSGSACRSFSEGFSLWGAINNEGRDDYAVKLEGPDQAFAKVYDAICIVSSSKKSVGSSAGHALMDEHIFKEARIKQANENCKRLITALRRGEVSKAGEVLEEEALTLHGLMGTSRPSFVLMRPGTIAIIDAIRSFRAANKVPVYFTLDAGPNPHVIYFESSKTVVENELLPTLRQFCENERIIADEIGEGARTIKAVFEEVMS